VQHAKAGLHLVIYDMQVWHCLTLSRSSSALHMSHLSSPSSVIWCKGVAWLLVVYL
jgi:hypothetical protein